MRFVENTRRKEKVVAVYDWQPYGLIEDRRLNEEIPVRVEIACRLYAVARPNGCSGFIEVLNTEHVADDVCPLDLAADFQRHHAGIDALGTQFRAVPFLNIRDPSDGCVSVARLERFVHCFGVLWRETALSDLGDPAPVEQRQAPTATTAPRPETKVAVAAGEMAIQAPMPGIVVKYLVAEGEKVIAGQTVVVLEAMKMENSLPSPNAGRVKSLTAAPGSKVAKDQILAIIA